MKKRIITISRQFGSGGHSIGESVSKKLGIPCYDKELLDRIATETGFAPNFVKEVSEYATSNSSILWNLVMNQSLKNGLSENPADAIYFAQSKIIRELAEKENCVIIGRCSDYILREREDCLHIFICSDKEKRMKRILEHYENVNKSVDKRIHDMDTRRQLYYSHYTDRVWGAPENYHAVFNSGALGEDNCVQAIIDLYK